MSIQQLMFVGSTQPTLLGAIQASGLTTSLELCLDAGDSNSYTSGQSWLDRSGNGYDFFLGVDGSGGSDDPTFTGTVGISTSYWLFDGTQYFTYDSANETWMTNIHKAGAKFTLMFCHYHEGTFNIGDDGSSANHVGFVVKGNTMQFIVGNGGGTALVKTGATTPSLDVWNMTAVSVDETASGFLYLNGSYSQVGGADTWNAAYTSPSSSAADSTMQIGAAGGNVTPASNTTRLSCVAAWSTNLSKAQLDLVFGKIRGRFGI